MANARMVHKKIWDSDQFNGLSIPERLLFIGLITMADDEGCFRGDAAYWRRIIFYSDRIGAPKVQIMLDHIAAAGLIVMGETKKGLAGYLPTWRSHQSLRLDRSKASEFIELLVDNGVSPRFTSTAEVKLDQSKQSQENINQDSFADVFKNFPSPREQMMQGFNRGKKISNDFGDMQI